MKQAVSFVLTPPKPDLKRSPSKSSVFKTLRKSFSTSSLGLAFKRSSRVVQLSGSNIYGDTYNLDVAPPNVLERMLRDDLRKTGVTDCTPYNNGAIRDLRPTRSVLHLSSYCSVNASTIPTLLVADSTRISPHPAPAGSYPQVRQSLEMTLIDKASLKHAASPRLGLSTSRSYSLNLSPEIGWRRAIYSPRTPLEEEPLTMSPNQQWFDEFHDRVDHVADDTGGSVTNGGYTQPRIHDGNDEPKPRIPYNSISITLTRSISDLEKRYEESYGTRAPTHFSRRPPASVDQRGHGAHHREVIRYTRVDA